MVNDLTQNLNSKELAKLTEMLAHKLLPQARLIKRDLSKLEHRAKEAQDPCERMREKYADLQDQVNKLQSALTEPRMDTEHRKQRNK